jgi:general stress protein 26
MTTADTDANTGAGTDNRSQLWSLIKDIKFGMFTTRHQNGHLHSQPMTTRNQLIDEDDRLWFFMSRRSAPVSDLLIDRNVNVCFADPGCHSYVSVSGEASAVSDPAKLHRLWTKTASEWFPGGVDDPDLALIEVQILHARYWDMKINKFTQLYHYAKIVVTGETSPGVGDVGEVHIR